MKLRLNFKTIIIGGLITWLASFIGIVILGIGFMFAMDSALDLDRLALFEFLTTLFSVFLISLSFTYFNTAKLGKSALINGLLHGIVFLLVWGIISGVLMNTFGLVGLLGAAIAGYFSSRN